MRVTKTPASSSVGSGKLSPGRLQYLHFKRKHPDSLLLFRIGDFYETFDEDAETMAKVLDIALTARDIGGGVKAPLAGIPYHALDSYLMKLVQAGLKVAIAEQVNPSDITISKGLVERAVVRIVTPGTLVEPEMLEEGSNNFLAAAIVSGDSAGLSYIDLSTSEFVTSQMDAARLPDDLSRIGPAETLVNGDAQKILDNIQSKSFGVVRHMDGQLPNAYKAEQILKDHFKSATLEAFGCEGKPVAIIAAATVMAYLAETQLGALPQVTSLRTETPGDFLILDAKAMEDLEILQPSGGRRQGPSLISTIDKTLTPMGKRLLKAWLCRPLTNVESIKNRQDIIENFIANHQTMAEVQSTLKGMPDLERLTNRIRAKSSTPRDLLSLSQGLARIPTLAKAMKDMGGNISFKKGSASFKEVVDLVQAAINPNNPQTVGDGNAIRSGFDENLDKVRNSSRNSRQQMAFMEAKERKETGIRTLKVGYNRLFGYYMEVSKSNLDKVPSRFEQRQTLSNASRFTTPELKELEANILMAKDKIAELERSAYWRVQGEVAMYADNIMSAASVVARLDTLCGLAALALENGWIRPEVNNGDAIQIEAGRHPVVEAVLGPGLFVPNDVDISVSNDKLIIITGPNMSGKSTFIRMTAVLTLLAQIGCFIPAKRAKVGTADRIFTRAGLSDDIAGGASTFMVEMLETASILNQATRRSLAVFDEIGRGTSTYDGLAITQAVAEYIHNSPKLGCRTLFATHFHEMTKLGENLPHAANYQVSVIERSGEVIFLHRIIPGGADKSYGVHVARLAGMPAEVVDRAWHLLGQMESTHSDAFKPKEESAQSSQLDMFSPQRSSVLAEIADMNLENMTPIDALNNLYLLKRAAQDEVHIL